MSSAERRRARTYRMRARAEHVDDTRRRIVEAAVALHGSVGPARTTFAGVAGRAGVTRATLYRHFPDETALFAACSAHWLARQPVPDPAAWGAWHDPVARMRTGLADVYRFYRAGEPMLTRIHRDAAFVPEAQRRNARVRDAQARDVLLAAFAARTRSPSTRLRAVIGHAVSFSTWRSLCVDQGLSDAAAVQAMIDLASATARRP